MSTKKEAEPTEAEAELAKLLEQAAAEGSEVADDEVEIDLSEAVTFEPFTADAPVEIVEAALKRGGDNAKSPGAPYLELKVRIFEGEFEGRVLWTNINLTGKGAGFGFDKLGAFGARSKDGQLVTRDNPKISLAGLKGLKAVAACAPDNREEYKHKVVIGRIKAYVSQAEAEADNLK